MIDNFIKQILKIKQYEIILYNDGKDNLTYEVILESGDSFIVQEVLFKKSDKNIKFIDEIISYISDDDQITFASNYLNKRFINYDGSLFQVMKKIDGKTINEEDINSNIIKKTAEYIGLFHNKIHNFDWNNYEEINYFKKMHIYRLEIEKLLEKELDNKINEIFSKMNIIAIPLKENLELPKGVIHGDPSFKNFLINDDKNIAGLIDYDMLSVNNYIWDLADIIRSYMKIEKFQKKEFELLINSYNDIRKLTKEENEELKNYCTMMILDTGFRYLLSCFESNNHKNLLGNKNDSLKKANRCLLEIKKLESFY